MIAIQITLLVTHSKTFLRLPRDFRLHSSCHLPRLFLVHVTQDACSSGASSSFGYYADPLHCQKPVTTLRLEANRVAGIRAWLSVFACFRSSCNRSSLMELAQACATQQNSRELLRSSSANDQGRWVRPFQTSWPAEPLVVRWSGQILHPQLASFLQRRYLERKNHLVAILQCSRLEVCCPMVQV